MDWSSYTIEQHALKYIPFYFILFLFSFIVNNEGIISKPGGECDRMFLLYIEINDIYLF